MNYEQKYKEALERAKDYIEKQNPPVSILYEIFPELQESEDERIRKGLIKALSSIGKRNWGGIDVFESISWLEKQKSVREIVERCKNSWYNEGKIDGMAEGLTNDEKYQQGWHDALEKQCQTFTKKDVDDAYLKGIIDAKNELDKQGEQKPILNFNANDWYVSKTDSKIHNMHHLVDKVEPKFHKGDWVVYCNDDVDLITGVEENGYCINNSGYIPFVCASAVRLWTIQDAKDGDVLADGNLPFIFKKIDANKYSYAYCGISVDDGFKIESDGESGEWTWMQDIKPATEEQRDLLFQKMKEAGYEWDADNKELRKIERKLTELAKGEDYGIDSLWHAQRILEKTFGKVEGYQSDDGILAHECAISAVKELYKQKHNTWSKEDNDKIYQVLAIVDDYRRFYTIKPSLRKALLNDLDNIETWLKSLKDRVQSQSKQEWSEEEKKRIDRIINVLDWAEDKGRISYSDWKDYVTYVKCLRPQPNTKCCIS